MLSELGESGAHALKVALFAERRKARGSQLLLWHVFGGRTVSLRCLGKLGERVWSASRSLQMLVQGASKRREDQRHQQPQRHHKGLRLGRWWLQVVHIPQQWWHECFPCVAPAGRRLFPASPPSSAAGCQDRRVSRLSPPPREAERFVRGQCLL